MDKYHRITVQPVQRVCSLSPGPIRSGGAGETNSRNKNCAPCIGAVRRSTVLARWFAGVGFGGWVGV